MATHNEHGKLGEQLAQNYLREQGYAILDTNWRLGKLEADIIAYKDGVIVLVEVKTRSSSAYGDPESFVDMKKQKAYVKMANAYARMRRRSEEVRCDVISVLLSGSGYRINHIEHAFSAIGMYR